MIHLWYSNYLEELVEVLVENVRAMREAGATDPFSPTTVIVPNRNIATFLKFRVAQRTGVVANWKFEYLYKFFREALVEDGVQILAKNDLHDLIIEYLRDGEALAHPELRAVVDYLGHAPDADARSRRTFQLAGQLAQVFEEYTLSRPRFLAHWPREAVLENEPYASTEVWQRRIWLDLFERGGRITTAAARKGRRIVPLPDALSLPTRSLRLPGQVHVFGLSYVARSFYHLFGQLSKRSHVLVYTLNPCMEYWEDVPVGWNVAHGREFGEREKQQAVLFPDEDLEDDSPPALRAWGKPGRDNIRALNMLTECRFAGRFVDPVADGDTVLHRLQRDILVRQPVTTMPAHEYDDESVQFLESPNVQREIEAVANEIWALRERAEEEGRRLEFHDIAVIVSDKNRDAYQARIRSVFESTGSIPHNIIDVTASSHRPYLEAVELLLGLPFGRFTRRELLRLMTHDNVVSRYRGADPDTWVRWCRELNILHGADESDHEGTYIDRNLYHWDQGLKRLVLGSFMAGDERLATLDGQEYLPRELAPAEIESAAQFVGLARGLIRDARRMQKIELPLAEWFSRIGALLHRYLEPVSDDDEYDRVRVTEFLSRRERRALSQAPVPFRIAYEFVAKELAGLEISRGQYLSEGVVVSSFLPMRPIPFKVVFITGLGERNFPRNEVRSPLDLRWAPEVESGRGEVISARSQDEYMFLETLISTRERLYLSHVARDGQTGETLEPSSVVRLLRFMLERHYMTPEALEKARREFPLRRWTEVGKTFQAEAVREATVSMARHKLEEYCREHAIPYPTLERALRDLEPGDRRRFTELLGVSHIEAPATSSGTEAIRVRIPQIRKFLESPIQGATSFHLGAHDDFADPFAVEDEVFETGSRERARLMRDAFLRTLVEFGGEPTRGDLERQYEQLAHLAVLRGDVPAGPFGTADRDKHVAVLTSWLRNWRAAKLGSPTVVNFGRETEHAATLRTRDPLTLEVRVEGEKRTVELTGKTEVLSIDTHTSVLLRTLGTVSTDGRGERLFLSGFLDQVVLSAAGLFASTPWRVLVNTATGTAPADVREFDPFDVEQAKGYLTAVIEDMLASVPAYFLPVEAVFSHRYAKRKNSLERWIDQYREEYSWCSFKQGPVFEPQHRFDAPDHAEAYIEKRFGPYFRRRRSVEG